MGKLSLFDKLRSFVNPSHDYATRFDVCGPDASQYVPGGITDSYSMHHIPVRESPELMAYRMGDVSPLMQTLIPRTRKINRGRVTTFEQTPAAPTKNARVRGNGTL